MQSLCTWYINSVQDTESQHMIHELCTRFRVSVQDREYMYWIQSICTGYRVIVHDTVSLYRLQRLCIGYRHTVIDSVNWQCYGHWQCQWPRVNHYTLLCSVASLNLKGDKDRVSKTLRSCRPAWMEIDRTVCPTATTSLPSWSRQQSATDNCVRDDRFNDWRYPHAPFTE